MSAFNKLLLIVCLAASPAFTANSWAQTPPAPQEAGQHAIEMPSWFKHSFLDIREDIKEAAHNGKRLIIFFHQNGCPYCKELVQVNFANRKIADKTRRHFDVIAINMWGDREVIWLDGKPRTEKAFAALLKVWFTPTLLFFDEQGNVVLRLNGYYPPHKFNAALDYVRLHLTHKVAFGDYLRKVKDAAPDTGRFHDEPFFIQPPYDFRRPTKPLLVFFEQRHCAGCDEMHATTLQAPETRTLLGHFEVARLHLFGRTPVVTPGGEHLSEEAWGRRLNVAYTPALVFFNRQGKEVFRIDAYLKTFHVQSALDYIASGAYRKQPSFQRFLQERADKLRARGVTVKIW